MAGKKPVKRTITALTATDALKEMGVKVEKRDIVKPGPKATLEDGDKVVFTDMKVVTKRVKREAVDFETVEREDSSMFEGETETVRSGVDGVRDVTYRLTYRNGKLFKTKVLKQDVLRSPVDAIVRVGTKEAAANFASGNSVWDRSRSARPAATGPRTPATATTAACSSTWAPGRATAARATRTSRAARPRSRSPRRSAPPPAATAPGRPARSRWACPSDRLIDVLPWAHA